MPPPALHILALDPFAGGSHRAVLAGWRTHSRHRFTLLELPGRHWKWRMRHACWTLARRAAALEECFDLVWTTDMLDLAAWRGLAPPAIAALPHVGYQHESQLLYPDRHAGARDDHYAFTNLLSAAAADAVWWSSAWHRDAALAAYRAWLPRYPDHQPLDAVERIAAHSAVLHPGITPIVPQPDRNGPCHLLWCARFEADKNPADFVAAIEALAAAGPDFRLSVIGGHETVATPELTGLRERHHQRIVHWGWQPDREAYARCLTAADIVVSTADHEFFGLAVVEALSAGCFPLLPRRLAYPEVLADFGADGLDDGLYAGSRADLVQRLHQLLDRHAAGELWQGREERGRQLAQRYAWSRQSAAWDAACERAQRREEECR